VGHTSPDCQGRVVTTSSLSVSPSSSSVHCYRDEQIALAAHPASPVFSTSLVAESSRDARRRRHSPVATERRPQPAVFSPPTDMDTDISAIIGQAADDNDMWKSDISFEVELFVLYRISGRFTLIQVRV